MSAVASPDLVTLPEAVVRHPKKRWTRFILPVFTLGMITYLAFPVFVAVTGSVYTALGAVEGDPTVSVAEPVAPGASVSCAGLNAADQPAGTLAWSPNAEAEQLEESVLVTVTVQLFAVPGLAHCVADGESASTGFAWTQGTVPPPPDPKVTLTPAVLPTHMGVIVVPVVASV